MKVTNKQMDSMVSAFEKKAGVKFVVFGFVHTDKEETGGLRVTGSFDEVANTLNHLLEVEGMKKVLTSIMLAQIAKDSEKAEKKVSKKRKK